MRLGIIGAMDVEVAILKERMTDLTVEKLGKLEFFVGKLGGTDVVVVCCGVGKVHAAMCAQTLCDRYGVSHIVNTGVAGSLDPSLDIGDVVVSRDAMYHDFDCHVVGYPVGQVPGQDVTAFPADEKLVELAFAFSEALKPGHTRIGRIATGDQFVCSDDQKKQIAEITQAKCTEMEGAAIAQTAYSNGVPFVILRAISDKADHSAQMDYPAFEKIAAEHCAAVTEGFAKCLQKTLE